MSETVFHSDGNLIDYTPAGAKAAGDIVFVGTLCGQVVSDIEANQKGALRVEGVVQVAKASATVLAAGAAVHWNNTTKLAVVAAADGKMGVAIGGGANGETFVLVKINR